MSKGTTMARRQRRFELRRANFLKIKNMYGPLSVQGQAWYDKMREDGNAAHQQHVSRVMDAREERLESTLNSLKETWAGVGYNDTEIEMLSEAWMLTAVKDADRTQSRLDKKESRRLMQEAHSSLIERTAK